MSCMRAISAASPNPSSSAYSAPCPKRLKTAVEPNDVIDLTGPDPPKVAMHITIDDDDDDEVEIVKPPPKVTPVKTDWNDNDVQVTGTLHETKLPHMRPHCTIYPFGDNGNARACDLCYCYVCDSPVKDCKEWSISHCNACDTGPRSFQWKLQRQNKTGGDAILEARIEHGKLLKNIFLSLSKVAQFVRLDCSARKGISCNANGDDPTCFASFELRHDAFRMLKCASELAFLYVNVKQMNMVLRNVKRQSHVVELRATNTEITVTVMDKHTGQVLSDPGKLSNCFNGRNRSSCGRPSGVYNCEARMPAADVKRIVGQLDKLPHLSEPFPCCITLHRRSNSIAFSIPQLEPLGAQHVLTQSGFGTSVIMATNTDSIRAQVNGRLLCLLMRPTPLSKSVYLKMSPDQSRPIELEYNLLTPAKTNIGRFSFFIKPLESADSFDAGET